MFGQMPKGVTCDRTANYTQLMSSPTAQALYKAAMALLQSRYTGLTPRGSDTVASLQDRIAGTFAAYYAAQWPASKPINMDTVDAMPEFPAWVFMCSPTAQRTVQTIPGDTRRVTPERDEETAINPIWIFVGIAAIFAVIALMKSKRGTTSVTSLAPVQETLA